MTKMKYEIIGDFTIENLGVKEDIVYDLEVQNAHNFFANNLLVHNSCYLTIPQRVIQQCKSDDINTFIDNIDNFIETKVQPIVNESSSELGNLFNAYQPENIRTKRETIFRKLLLLAKKRYFMSIYDNEGVRYQTPKSKMQGIDLVRSSTPAYSKKYLNEAINVIMDKTEAELKAWLANVQKDYHNQDLSDIGKVSSISKLNFNLKTDKGIPINARAAIVTNEYIKNNCADEFTQIQSGEKVKMLYLKTPNPLNSNIFAFNNERFAQRFKQYIDYDTNFDKFFLTALELMVEPLGYDLRNTSNTLDEW